MLDILSSGVGLTAVGLIGISAISAGVRAWAEGSYYFGILNIPEWPGHFVFVLGLFAFLIRLIDLIIYDIFYATDTQEHDESSGMSA